MKDFELICTLGNFEIISGSGAYSTVFKVKRLSDGEVYALKSMFYNL